MRLHDFLDYYAREYPDADFAIQGDRRVSYGGAIMDVNRMANAFVSAGIHKGDRVAILSKNSIEYVIAYYAASKAGVVPVPLNYRLSPSEWAYIINDSRSNALIASGEYVEACDGIRGELETVGQFIAIGGGNAPGWTDYHSWASGQPATPPDIHVTDEDDLYQMYTSGTTGHPKGAVLTHSNIGSNLMQASPAIECQRSDRFLIVAPLYHTAAAFASFSTIYRGGCLYIQKTSSLLR